MLLGTLKAAIKKGVVEFFGDWQGFLDKQILLNNAAEDTESNIDTV